MFLKYPHWSKKVCTEGFSLITPIAYCKAYEIYLLTIFKYTSQLVKLQICKLLHIMKLRKQLKENGIWHLFETYHKCQPHSPLKLYKKYSVITSTSEAAMSFMKKFNIFLVLHYTVLHINVTEQ